MLHTRFLGVLLLATPAAAQWSSDPAVNLSVADGASDQIISKLAATSDGGVWMSFYDGIANGFDVRVQKLDAGGNEVLAHNGVLVADRGFSSVQDHGLSVDTAGNALLTFRDDSGVGTQITAARVTTAGVVDWSIMLTNTTDFVAAPVITGTSDGGSVVAWTQNSDAVLQKLDSAGVPQWGAGVTLTPGAGSYTASDIHAAGTDVILSIVHQTGNFSSPKHILAQKLDSTGSLQWGAGHVAVFDGGSLQFGNFPEFVPDGSGGGVFSWYAVSPLQCYVQRILSNGSEAFAHNGVAVSTDATRIRTSPWVDFESSTSESFVFWPEQNGAQSMWGLYGQKLDSAGNRQWGATGSALISVGGTAITQVRTLVNGTGAQVFWEESASFGQDVLRGARIDAAGSFDIGPFDVGSTPSSKLRLDVARSTSGHAILTWDDDRVDSGSVYGQNVNKDGTLGASGPGTPSCFGVGCPCGNDAPSAGCANSTGSGGLLSGSGSTSVLSDDLILTATQLPPTNSGLYYMGNAVVSNHFYDGFQCALGTTLRFLCCIQNSGAGGTMTLGPGIVGNSSGLITPGTTWHFHAWHRDVVLPSPCGTGANLTNLYSVTYGP